MFNVLKMNTTRLAVWMDLLVHAKAGWGHVDVAGNAVHLGTALGGDLAAAVLTVLHHLELLELQGSHACIIPGLLATRCWWLGLGMFQHKHTDIT